jgi:ABC-type Zn uptake system ZnuABC Zn-binding protein ZnuA
MGDVHPSGNPHYWLDPGNGRRIAQAIQAKLGELDGAGKRTSRSATRTSTSAWPRVKNAGTR